jgi:hypothetical protein
MAKGRRVVMASGRPLENGSAPLCVVHTLDGTLSADGSAWSGSAPFLPQLLQEIAARLGAPDEARGRSYQTDIARQGFFLATSPRTGKSIPSGDSIILPDRTIFYRFPDCPDLLLGAANLGKGYPILAVALLTERLLFQVGERAWGVKEGHLLAAEEVLREPRWWPPRAARQLQVLTGDPNFAHHAWNQLASFEGVLRQATDWFTELKTWATFQPLGPLEKLFPEVVKGEVPWQDCKIPGECNLPGQVSLNAGGFLLTAAVRERLWALADRLCGERRREELAGLALAHRPVVWVSVRTRNRTPVNQREFVVAVCRRLFSLYDRCAVVLDGHSLPEDFSTNPSYDREDALTCVRRDEAEIAAIQAELKKGGLPRAGQAVVRACGLSMLDAVALARRADFYLCHHGTVQHKIGWLAAKPGVVHSNRRTLTLEPARWVREQCEGGEAPLYLPAELVGEERGETSTDEEVRSQLFENYRIVDVERAADFVLLALRAQVPAASKEVQRGRPGLGRRAVAALRRGAERFFKM